VIDLPSLDFDRVRAWISDAGSRADSDPVHAFVSAWIAFNHYYATFASEHEDELRSSLNKRKGRIGDSQQWRFLSNHPSFTAYFADFRNREPAALQIRVALPVIDMLAHEPVPENRRPGEYPLADLGDEELFSVIYQVRNNLFHGSKNPEKSARDRELASQCGAFLQTFIKDLAGHTFGEVLNAYDPDVLTKMPR